MISRKNALKIFVDAVNSPNADVASIKSAAITFNKADENAEEHRNTNTRSGQP